MPKFIIEDWRYERRKMMRHLPKGQKGKARYLIATRLQAEGNRRAFDELKLNKAAREKAEAAIHRAKVRELRRWDKTLSPDDASELAETRTLLKVSEHERIMHVIRRRRRAYRYVSTKWGRNGEPLEWKQEERRRIKGRVKWVAIERKIPTRVVNHRYSDRARYQRIRVLARALDVTIAEARRADKLMIAVPDAVRRRIYDSVIRQVEREARRHGWKGSLGIRHRNTGRKSNPPHDRKRL